MIQRMLAVQDSLYDETPSMAWLHMAHVGELSPIWDLPDFTSAETLHLLSLVEFTDLLNGCSPDILVRNAFVLLAGSHSSLQRPHHSLGPGPRASGGPQRSVEGKRSGGAQGFSPFQPAGDEPC